MSRASIPRTGRLQGWEYKKASAKDGVLTLEIGAKPFRNQAARFKPPPPKPTDMCKGCGQEYSRHQAQIQDLGPAKYACPCRDDWWEAAT